MQRGRAAGFTLVEILVVLAIAVLLAGILIPAYMRLSRNQAQGTCINNLREIGVALAQYREDFGVYPAAPATEFYDPAKLGNPVYLPVSNDVFTNPNAEPADRTLKISATGGANAMDIAVSGTYARDYPLLITVKIVAADQATWATSETPAGAPEPFDTPFVIGDTGLKVLDDGGPPVVGATWQFWGVPTTQEADVSKRTPITQNFGLATLYYLFLRDTKDYVRSTKSYHCQALSVTRNVDRGATLAKLTDPAELSARYDPLWGGYNSYDLTYNYGQYDSAIQKYEAATGLVGLQTPRQLKNTHPPADTVVTWCYAHRSPQEPGYDKTELGSPVPELTLASTPAEIAVLEKTRQDELDIVLWLDGSADVMHSRLARGIDGYYWTPPFLASRGDWRK
jgi:prepilin-type N-terminal cleavage/methylation domain-containing protein